MEETIRLKLMVFWITLQTH